MEDKNSFQYVLKFYLRGIIFGLICIFPICTIWGMEMLDHWEVPVLIAVVYHIIAYWRGWIHYGT